MLLAISKITSFRKKTNVDPEIFDVRVCFNIILFKFLSVFSRNVSYCLKANIVNRILLLCGTLKIWKQRRPSGRALDRASYFTAHKLNYLSILLWRFADGRLSQYSDIESKDTPTLKKLRICQRVNKFQSCQQSRSMAGPILLTTKKVRPESPFADF